MTEPPLSFRIVNWIGIIDQLASTEANRVLKPLGLQMPLFVLLNHFSHRPDEPRTVTGIARALQSELPTNIRESVLCELPDDLRWTLASPPKTEAAEVEV